MSEWSLGFEVADNGIFVGEETTVVRWRSNHKIFQWLIHQISEQARIFVHNPNTRPNGTTRNTSRTALTSSPPRGSPPEKTGVIHRRDSENNSTTKPLHHHIRTGNKLFHHEQPSPHLESLRNTYGSTKHQGILNRLQSIHRHLKDMSEIEIEKLEN
ncbi:hypothetical protein Bca4012_004308 [Brassica carinata]